MSALRARVSVRHALMLVLSAFVVLCALIGTIMVGRWNREQAAMEHMRTAHGCTAMVGHRVIEFQALGAVVPERFRYCFERVEAIVLTAEDVGGDCFASLAELPELRSICLLGCSGANDALPYIQRSPHIEWLEMVGTDLTDDGMMVVGTMHNLKGLSFSYTKISDVGFRAVGRLQRLESLQAEDVEVTSSSLELVKKLPHLKRLRLSSPDVPLQVWPVRSKTSENKGE